MTQDEKRQKQIREKAHFEATKFSVRYGYADLEEELYKMAIWADETNPILKCCAVGIPAGTIGRIKRYGKTLKK